MNALTPLLNAGNGKLPRTTAIFNLGSATDCPSRPLGFCQAYRTKDRHVCYALHSERQFPHVLPFRRRQAAYWDHVNVAEFIAQFLMAAPPRRPWTHLRLSEAGDFRHQADVDKAEAIAAALATVNVTTYCYTARRDLEYGGCTSLVVLGSGFRVHGEFRLIQPEERVPDGAAVCPADCTVCDRCPRGQDTLVRLHTRGREQVAFRRIAQEVADG